MTTTATKVSAAAPFATSFFTNEALTATTTPQATVEATAATFKLLNTFKLYVVGQTSAEKEPTKSMTKWSTDTAASRKSAGVDISSNVSSFAIVVDLTTKQKVGGAGAQVFCGSSNTNQTNIAGTPLTTCVVGTIGNQVGFWIQNGTTTTTTL